MLRIRPNCNEWRFFHPAVWPDLFGCALLVRHWSRTGTEGHRRLDSHPDRAASLLRPNAGSAIRIAGNEPRRDANRVRSPLVERRRRQPPRRPASSKPVPGPVARLPAKPTARPAVLGPRDKPPPPQVGLTKECIQRMIG